MPPDSEIVRLGADIGAITVSSVKNSEFGKGYELCMTISLFARNKGHAYIFYYSMPLTLRSLKS
jgi:hypothetical protein